MKTILHWMKKDLVRLRWAWLLWTLLLGAEIVLAELLLSPRSIEAEFYGRGTAIQMLLLLGHALACGVIVSFSVMEDSPNRDGSFWATRPISGGQLLAAKLAGTLLMFWVWPVLVALPWWLYCGMRGGELAGAVGQAGLFNLAVIVPVWALAAVSRNYGRFALAVFLSGLTLLVMLLVASTRAGGRGSLPVTNLQLTVPALLVFGAAVATMILQYVARSARWAKGVLLSGWLAAVALAWLDPRGAWFASPAPVRPLPGGGELQPRVTSATLDWGRPDEPRLRVEFALAGGAEDLTLMSGTAHGQLTWADGTTYALEAPLGREADTPPPRFFGATASAPDAETAAELAKQRETLRQRREAAGRRPSATHRDRPWLGGGRRRWLEAALPADVAARLAAEAPRMEIDCTFRVGRMVESVRVPLQAGQAVTHGGVRLAVLQVTRSAVAEKKPASEDIIVVYAGGQIMEFFQLDPGRGTVMPLSVGWSIDLPLLPLGCRLVRSSFSVPVPQLWRTDHWVWDRESMRRSVLVGTSVVPLGHVAARLALEAFRPAEVERAPAAARAVD